MAAHRHINNRTMRACVRAYVCARYEFTGKKLGAGSFGTVVEAFDRGEAGLLTQAAAAAAARTDAANGGRGTRVAVKNCQVARLEKLDDYAYSEVLRQLSPLSLSLPIHARAHTHTHTRARIGTRAFPRSRRLPHLYLASVHSPRTSYRTTGL